MFGLGFSELIVIVICFIVFVPPREYPRLARLAGRVFRYLRALHATVMNELQAISDIEYNDQQDKKGR